MNPFDENDPEGIPATVRLLLHQMKLSERTLDAIYVESDWSVVIKLHAMFEATLTRAIVLTLHRPELEDVVARMDMGDKRAGKIEFGKRLIPTLNAAHWDYLNKLAELRNKLVHRIENIEFSFDAHYTAMDMNQRRAFVRSFSLARQTEMESNPEHVKHFSENLKSHVWLSGMFVLAAITLAIQSALHDRNAQKLKDVMLEQYRRLEEARSKLDGELTLTQRALLGLLPNLSPEKP